MPAELTLHTKCAALTRKVFNETTTDEPFVVYYLTTQEGDKVMVFVPEPLPQLDLAIQE